MMRTFVKDRRLPESGTYVEVPENDAEKRAASFAALAELLTGDAGYAKQSLGRQTRRRSKPHGCGFLKNCCEEEGRLRLTPKVKKPIFSLP